MVAPDPTMQTTPSIEMRENRSPISRQQAPSCTRASAETKQGMPPIQIAAPNWCSPSTASSNGRSVSRAAAWVVSVAAASSTRPAASSSDAGARRPASSSASNTTAAPIFTSPATAKLAPSTLASGRSSVPISTAHSSPTVATSQTISATAPQAAMRMVSRRIAAPAGPTSQALGRARNTRKKTPPSAIDWAVMVRPWMMIER